MGKCNKGADCSFLHIADPNFKRKPCMHFARGNCRHGQECKFSHDQDDIDYWKATNNYTAPSTNGSHMPQRHTTEDLFRSWRATIPTPNRPGTSRYTDLPTPTFFRDAFELVQGETQTMQEVITLLAGEGGLQKISQLFRQASASPQFERLVQNQLLPLFKTITHKNVLASLVLSSRLMNIFNVIYSDSANVTLVFAKIVDLLEDSQPFGTTHIHCIVATVATLGKMLEVCTPARVNPEFTPIVETLGRILQADFSEDQQFSLRDTKKELVTISRRLDLPVEDLRDFHHVNGPLAYFQLARDLPGELSELGPRHDNDHADICSISILPTVDEISSSRSEYLPLADSSTWHISGVQGLIDRHFRLLREDTIGQLRDAARVELDTLRNAHGRNATRGNMRTFSYPRAYISDAHCDSRRGLELCLEFDQPELLAAKTSTARRTWWESSKRLAGDSLVCLLGADGTAAFFTVVHAPDIKKASDTDGPQSHVPFHQRHTLWGDARRAAAIVKPVQTSDMDELSDHLLADHMGAMSLVEFPGVLLPAFMPTLQAMQSIKRDLNLPFAEFLTPGAPQASHQDAHRPAYATRPGFRFDLSKITKDGLFNIAPADLNNEDQLRELTSRSTLDPGQAQAVLSSLSRPLALIQGPPGTGKSYTGVKLMQIFLTHAKSSQLGPIVVCCFTNHALDQSLERLLDDDVGQIIRIGSRSKSARLQEVSLYAVSQRADLTKQEKMDRYALIKQLAAETGEINTTLDRISRKDNPKELESFVFKRDPQRCVELSDQEDENGFEIVDRRSRGVLQRWLRSGLASAAPTRDLDELEDVHAHDMTAAERQLLFRSWKQAFRHDLETRLRLAVHAYSKHKNDLDAIKHEVDIRVLRNASVIGVTTSGLARNLDVLRRVNAKVLVCEEAGEVLEAHLLTALLPSLEHAVLIGDHQQLRPHIQNHELSIESPHGRKYSLDVSLFERLVRPHGDSPGIPFSTLDVQRRMHPSISELVQKTQYPSLKNAPSVQKFPPVVGFKKRLFWFNHGQEEDEQSNASGQSMSRTNMFEVDMVEGIVRHLVQQGVYSPDDIAVITPYLGQLRQIRRKLGESFQILLNDRDTVELEQDQESQDDEPLLPVDKSVSRGSLLQALRLATVDNFQGEEAKVVIVSLVRSNKMNKPGFLKTPNRINVLLSRAQHGMYVIGNVDTMQQVPMFTTVIDLFRQGENLGPSLALHCARHPDTAIEVTKPEDFARLSPEGGCQELCIKQLSCGHACVSQCHSDMLHDSVQCMKPCTRPKSGCSHNCPLPCSEKCEKFCHEIIEGVEVDLPCGHQKTSVPCYQHQNPALILCEEPVPRVLPQCGHTATEPCHLDVENEDYRCTSPCGAMLPCGHTCKRACHECRKSDVDGNVTLDHGKCKQVCDRNFSTCSHRCTAKCHGSEPCPLCKAPCDTRCAHAACQKRCHEPCTPCAEEQCQSHCPHAACRLPCAAPCDWLPCHRRCEKTLACGCQCPSVCGEPCPSADFCQNCATDEIKDLEADMIMFETYAEIDLDTNPCLFLACGHVFSMTTLDGLLEFDKHYETDATGATTRILSPDQSFLSEHSPRCPHCRGSLHDLSRYARMARRALLDQNAKRLTASANQEFNNLAEALQIAEEDLQSSLEKAHAPVQDIFLLGSPAEQIKAVLGLTTSARYRRIIRVHSAIAKFANKLSSEEQPYQRIRQLVETARRRNQGAGVVAFEFDPRELQLREALLARSLLIRCHSLILADVFVLVESRSSGRSLQAKLEANRAECEQLSFEAGWTSNIRQEAEGHILWARFAALERSTMDIMIDTEQCDSLERDAREHLAAADKVIARNAATVPAAVEGLGQEIKDIESMLEQGTSISEMKMVFQVMQREFGGTGHWYRCANGHPFTVGECGMPMQLARCPSCGAGIGGEHHRATAGVSQARDIDERFGAMALN